MRVDMTGGAGCPRQVGEAFGRPAGLWCAGGAGVPGGRATTSRRAGCRRLPPDDADWSFSSGLSSVPRTEPCGYRRVTAALRPRGRGRRAARRCAPARAFPGPARPRPRREGPGATAPGPPGPESRVPTWSSGAPAAGQPGVRWVGGIHLYQNPGRGPICLATVAGLLYQEGGRVRHWGDHTRHRPLVCEAIDMAARRCPTRRGKTIHPAPGRGTPARLRPARQAPERLRHSPFGGQDRGALGGCPGGSRRARPPRNDRAHTNGAPHQTQDHQRYCLPDRAWYTSQTRLHTGARVPDTGRDRVRAGKQ